MSATEKAQATSQETGKEKLIESNEEKLILRRDNEEYKIVKRLPKRFPVNNNDIYITNKTDFRAQYEKCKYLLSALKNQTEPNEICLHAMGSAINR